MRRRSAVSASRKSSSRARPSMRWTSIPSAAKMQAYSHPMTPAPITASRRGSRLMARMESLS